MSALRWVIQGTATIGVFVQIGFWVKPFADENSDLVYWLCCASLSSTLLLGAWAIDMYRQVRTFKANNVTQTISSDDASTD